jgi:hypothetical protein
VEHNVKGKRYTRGFRGEEQLSKNIREMIAMIKNEEVSNGRIKYGKLQLSRHALLRAKQFLNCSEKHAIVRVKCILRQSRRVGEQLAYDGRINVLFVYKQFAIYLSPNLEHVVTIHKFKEVSYSPIKNILPQLESDLKGVKLKRELVRLHKEAWSNIEKIEFEQQKKVLQLEADVNETITKLKSLKGGYSPKHYKKYLSGRFVEERERLVVEGEKLFKIKLEKRHIGKSITSVLNA